MSRTPEGGAAFVSSVKALLFAMEAPFTSPTISTILTCTLAVNEERLRRVPSLSLVTSHACPLLVFGITLQLLSFSFMSGTHYFIDKPVTRACGPRGAGFLASGRLQRHLVDAVCEQFNILGSWEGVVSLTLYAIESFKVSFAGAFIRGVEYCPVAHFACVHFGPSWPIVVRHYYMDLQAL